MTLDTTLGLFLIALEIVQIYLSWKILRKLKLKSGWKLPDVRRTHDLTPSQVNDAARKFMVWYAAFRRSRSKP